MSAINLTSDQLRMIKRIDVHAASFSFSDFGEAQLLGSCYDYMDDFKYVLDSTSKPQLDYIYQQYDGFYRFAKLMERLAQGIAEGVVQVPKDH